MGGRVTESQVDPATWAEAVTTSDTTNHTNGPYRGIIVTTAGAYKIRTLQSQDAPAIWGPMPDGLQKARQVFKGKHAAADHRQHQQDD